MSNRPKPKKKNKKNYIMLATQKKKKYKHTFKPMEKTIEFKRTHTHKTSIFT